MERCIQWLRLIKLCKNIAFFSGLVHSPVSLIVDPISKEFHYPGKQTRSRNTGLAVIFFSCSVELIMNFFLLINVEMPTIVRISAFMGKKTSILGLSEPEKCLIS